MSKLKRPDGKLKYSCLVLPNLQGVTIHENELSDPVKKELIEDWNDIHGVAKDFGTPEFADHMSGHIFMQGTPIEDKCSKCVRIGDLFHLFNDDQLKDGIYCITEWRDSVKDSEILKNLVKRLDEECCHRLEKFSESEKLSLSFALSELSKFVDFRMPQETWRWCVKNLNLSDENLIYLLLLSSFYRQHINAECVSDTWSEFESSLIAKFHDLSHTELSVCFQGLDALSQGQSSKLKEMMKEIYGFRM